MSAEDRSDPADVQIREAASSQSEDQRSREDDADRAVALPRLRRYRAGQAKLIKHEDLMQELG